VPSQEGRDGQETSLCSRSRCCHPSRVKYQRSLCRVGPSSIIRPYQTTPGGPDNAVPGDSAKRALCVGYGHRHPSYDGSPTVLAVAHLMIVLTHSSTSNVSPSCRAASFMAFNAGSFGSSACPSGTSISKWMPRCSLLRFIRAAGPTKQRKSSP